MVGPVPFSPVHNARKFSAVLGTTSANNSKTMRPTEMTDELSIFLSPILGMVMHYWANEISVSDLTVTQFAFWGCSMAIAGIDTVDF